MPAKTTQLQTAVCPEPSINATRLVTPPAVERLLNIYAMKREMWAGMRPREGQKHRLNRVGAGMRPREGQKHRPS